MLCYEIFIFNEKRKDKNHTEVIYNYQRKRTKMSDRDYLYEWWPEWNNLMNKIFMEREVRMKNWSEMIFIGYSKSQNLF